MSSKSDPATTFYKDAPLYDILHRPGTAEEVTFLQRVHARFGLGPRSGPWLEPACGTARLARLAAARGQPVAGFDLEPAMIAYARDHTPPRLRARTRFFKARMEDFDTALPKRGPWSRYSLAFNLINTIRHLHSDRAMLDHFDAVARVLKPNALYAVGISLSLYGIEQETEDVWQGTRGTCKVSQVVQYIPPECDPVNNSIAPPASTPSTPRSANVRSKGSTSLPSSLNPRGGNRLERVISHLTITRPRGEEHKDSAYSLRTYDLHQWQALLHRSPFKVHTVVGDDGVEIPPPKIGYAIWVLGLR